MSIVNKEHPTGMETHIHFFKDQTPNIIWKGANGAAVHAHNVVGGEE